MARLETIEEPLESDVETESDGETEAPPLFGEAESLGEEIFDSILFAVPFMGIFIGLDFAAHTQYMQEFERLKEIKRVLIMLPTIAALSFLVNRPASRAILPKSAANVLIAALSLASGYKLLQVAAYGGYATVMRMAPPLGTLWMWTIFQLPLSLMVVCLGCVAFAGYSKGLIKEGLRGAVGYRVE